jgi:hypothetical protein
MGCQCSPAFPPAKVEPILLLPVVTTVALPSPPVAIESELVLASHYASPQLAIEGHQLRSLLCVWRN